MFAGKCGHHQFGRWPATKPAHSDTGRTAAAHANDHEASTAAEEDRRAEPVPAGAAERSGTDTGRPAADSIDLPERTAQSVRAGR